MPSRPSRFAHDRRRWSLVGLCTPGSGDSGEVAPIWSWDLRFQALLNPTTVPTEQPLWRLQSTVACGSDGQSGHRTASGHQLTTWSWQVLPRLWGSVSQLYNEGAPPNHPGVHPLETYYTASQSDSLPGSCELKGSEGPGAGVGMCPANTSRIQEAQPVSGGTRTCLPYLCQSHHLFSPQVASVSLASPLPGSGLSLILSLADLTCSAVLWHGLPLQRAPTVFLGPSGNTGFADGNLRLPGEVLAGRDILFSRWPATCCVTLVICPRIGP